jgi:hypothetical protein
MKRVAQLLAGLGLIGMMAFSGAGVAAQDGGNTSLLVQSFYCADEGGLASGNCTPASGVTVSAQLLDGGALGSCVTEAGMVRDAAVGYCYIEVPYGVEVLVTQDDATLSQGYVSTNNPQQVSVRAEGDWPPDYIPVAAFINVAMVEAPAPVPEPEAPTEVVEEVVEAAPVPVITLPSTGSGTAPDESPLAMVIAAGTVTAAVLGAASRHYRAEKR